MKLYFPRQTLEKYSNIKVRETRRVAAEFFRADKRTHRHGELIVTFRNFAKAPKNPFTSWL